ncbi:MAG: SDR family NAD(P)-dependent oxidoreductase [Alphaproteobacteria bacterium]|nr:SDR family NAD(P)-dependent oxidoreductase [Alphaproteobacteria bacterium]
MLESQGRVVMVSGANRGIGRAIAVACQARGYKLSLGVRKPETLTELEADDVLVHEYDAERPETATAWMKSTFDRYRRVDGLVNNAGVYISARVEDGEEADFDRLWAVNVKGPLKLVQLALPHLKKAGHGRIINLISLAGKRVPSDDSAGYAMSKHAALALHHATRRAGWDHGVRATAICPGLVATDMVSWSKVPREEMIDPADLAEIIATIMALPDHAVVAELMVNCRLEPTL